MSPLDALAAPLATTLRARGDMAAAVAARHADAVDRDAVLPLAAIAAMRSQGLFGAPVPLALRGEAATLTEIAAVACSLGRACSASAMIFAMHHIQLACLLAHAGDNEWQRDFLHRVASEQLLLASVTSEAGVGGDIRQSRCAVEADGATFKLHKQGTAISYGAAADALLITARRCPDAVPSDQVLVVAPRETLRLERTGGWNPMGMRGTCTEAQTVTVSGVLSQILAAPFGEIAGDTMLPVSHVLWGALWLGIASDAMDRARAFLRAALRKGGPTPGAARLVDAVGSLRLLRGEIRSWLDRVDFGPGRALSIADGIAINNLKIQASETCLHAVREAMLVCGFAGYQNEGPFSLARHLRDLQSAPLMVNNDRIRASNAGLLLGPKLDLGLL